MVGLYIAGRADTRRPGRRPRSRMCTGHAATPSLRNQETTAAVFAPSPREKEESPFICPRKLFLGVTLLVLSRCHSHFPSFGRSSPNSCSAAPTHHHCFAALQWMVVGGDKVAQLGFLLRRAALVAGRE